MVCIQSFNVHVRCGRNLLTAYGLVWGTVQQPTVIVSFFWLRGLTTSSNSPKVVEFHKWTLYSSGKDISSSLRRLLWLKCYSFFNCFFSHIFCYFFCFLVLLFSSIAWAVMIAKHSTSDVHPWLQADCNWCLHKCVDGTSSVYSAAQAHKCFGHPHFCLGFHSHFSVLWNGSLWTAQNSEKIRCRKFVVKWNTVSGFFLGGGQTLKWQPMELCLPRHVPALLVHRASRVWIDPLTNTLFHNRLLCILIMYGPY